MAATQQKRRNLERFFLLMICIVLGLLFFNLFNVLKRDFKDVYQRLANGTMVNLNDNNTDQRIRNLLEKGFYFEDPKDIQLVYSVVSQGVSNNNEGAIDNIGELNKAKYNINAEEAYAKGGVSFRKRILLSRSLLGFTGPDSVRFLQEKTAPPPLPAINNISLGKHNIGGNIFALNAAPVSGVLVRLQMILPQDSVYSENVSEITNEKIESSALKQIIYSW